MSAFVRREQYRKQRRAALAIACMAIWPGTSGAVEPTPSPWMFTPLVASTPKLGTSAGAMAAYVKTLNPQAPPSLFGVFGQYSSTDSYTLAAFARAFLGADTHRIVAVEMHARANNEYQDFLGSGMALRTTDEVHVSYLSYLKRVSGNWFLGVHGVRNDYAMLGTNDTDDALLEELDLEGFNSNALGLKVQYDSRDNTQSPGTGSFFLGNHYAYRESLGGEVSFDVLAGEFRHYFPQGEGSVLAGRVTGRFTRDATPSGYSTLRLRGYVPGEFRQPHVVSVEAEERYRLAPRWGLAVFAGAACLFEHVDDCGDTASVYAAGGIGLHYVIRPREKMIVRLDYGRGEGGSEGLYLKFGQSF